MPIPATSTALLVLLATTDPGATGEESAPPPRPAAAEPAAAQPPAPAPAPPAAEPAAAQPPAPPPPAAEPVAEQPPAPAPAPPGAVAAPPGETPRRGWDVLPWPLLNFTTDEGLGYGLRVMLINRGEGEKPYRFALTGQFFQTTRDISLHLFRVDMPRLFGSPYRVDAEVSYRAHRFAPYYGLGNESVYEPAFSACADRQALAIDPDTCPGNPAFRGLRYYTYDWRMLPRLSLNVRRDLAGAWKAFGGYRAHFVTLHPEYPNDLGQRRDSRLVEDARAGRLVGYDGQSKEPFRLRSAEVTAGVVYDDRDNEPSPTRGMFHELSVRAGVPFLGSQFSYWGLNTRLRAYYPIVPGYRALIGAVRLMADVAGGDVPFYLLPSFGGLIGYEEGIGGIYTGRGILSNRYQGKEKLVLSGEVRWRFAGVSLLGQQLDFSAILGLDTGRVWSDLDLADGGGLHAGASGGLRMAWNRDFIVRFDYGMSLTERSQGLYLDFGQSF